jgi:hypothetical protein
MYKPISNDQWYQAYACKECQWSPGILLRIVAPASRGANIVFNRLARRGPGFMVTAEPKAPRSWHNMNGIVKMPRRLEETVSSNASAVLPPTDCSAHDNGSSPMCDD